MEIKIMARSNGIPVTLTALGTFFLVMVFYVDAWLIIVAVLANVVAVAVLVSQLISSKAIFGDDEVCLKYGFIRNKIPYENIRKIVATKRSILLWHKKVRPADIWMRNESKDAFLEEIYKRNPSLKKQEEVHSE